MPDREWRVDYELDGEKLYEIVDDPKLALQMAARMRRRCANGTRRPLYRNVQVVWPEDVAA